MIFSDSQHHIPLTLSRISLLLNRTQPWRLQNPFTLKVVRLQFAAPVLNGTLTKPELMTLHNDFHHGHYNKVLTHNLTTTSSAAVLPARVLQLRAQIALGQQSEVLADISGEESTPDLAAVKALALYTSDAGSQDEGLQLAEELAETEAENASVQVLAGTVLAAAGKVEEALGLLSKHQGTLEAVALTAQLQLLLNRGDLAGKEVGMAKKWAQDSLLINIAESWVGLRVVSCPLLWFELLRKRELYF